MQFKHPELLYALFLLVIPILIHLFQLRRFQKIPFTNVKFLKEVELQTRKSSRLKKFLILCTRLLLFAALIFAFAQPFTSASKAESPTHTTIYLDNSYSMQAKGEEGELLRRAVQDIIENTQNLENINLYTNDNVYENLSSKELKNTLLEVDYYPIKTDLSSILFKIQNNIKKSNTLNNIFIISDFQRNTTENKVEIDTSNTYYITQILPEQISNVSIDSVFISNQNSESIQLTVSVKNYGATKENVSVSLYDNDLLSGKSTVNLTKDGSEEINFNIPNTNNFNGKLQLEDENLAFDNDLFFTINKPEKINVTAIGNDNGFLSKIYTDDEFNLTSTTLNNLDYNTLDNQQLLILNELETIPSTLNNTLKKFAESSGSIVIIPALKINLNSYNNLFSALRFGSLQGLVNSELSVTTINISHPLLKGVFEKQVKNFQYPNVKSSYRGNFNRASSIVNFEDGKPFILQTTYNKGKVYWLSASIRSQNSNFKSSPLIVPVFYNFGLYNYNASKLYYTIGKLNTIEIPTKLSKDEVLHLANDKENYIPLQQINPDKVIVTTEANPAQSGFTKMLHNGNIIGQIAYNFDRSESNLIYTNLEEYFGNASNINYSKNVESAFISLNNNTKITNYWKWFLMASILFLIIEILLLKFL
ncbi:BatA domain-containing protein [Aureibaculum sp. 2210JD6-5]|uniref:BatA domain-containing protein n=1 Tax=Aureibaculum sp. 2210JD6-5 TaxID=3103957 RepID=UPI002AAED354|nr:BatA domain-containing protein [Aureibaculum sp. 2210JD6-5]MDY7395605.1 BatA domain-containing protein [Aureibaculum sp. 2210JD6-5]